MQIRNLIYLKNYNNLFNLTKLRPPLIVRTYASKDNTKLSPFNWKRLGISVGIVSVIFAGGIYYKREKELEFQRQRKRALGKASIGGSFELVDYDNKPVSSKDFLGQWVFMYFGFTHCPDVCPDELEKMCTVVDQLEKKGKKIQPIFISVDPARDTPPIVKSYVKEFSPKLLGLTGTQEQVDKTTKAYRVYYSAGPRDEVNDYIVDHTIITYLINPEGEFVDYYGQTKTANDITHAVIVNMEKYDIMKKRSWK